MYAFHVFMTFCKSSSHSTDFHSWECMCLFKCIIQCTCVIKYLERKSTLWVWIVGWEVGVEGIAWFCDWQLVSDSQCMLGKELLEQSCLLKGRYKLLYIVFGGSEGSFLKSEKITSHCETLWIQHLVDTVVSFLNFWKCCTKLLECPFKL